MEEQGTAVQNWGNVANYVQVFDPMATVSGPSYEIDGSANRYVSQTNWGYQLTNNTGNALTFGFDYEGAVQNGLHFSTGPTASLISVSGFASGAPFPVMLMGTNQTLTYNPSTNVLATHGSTLGVDAGFLYNAGDFGDDTNLAQFATSFNG